MTTNAETTNTNETANAAEQGAPVAPEKATPKKGASQKKGAPKGQKSAKGAAQPTTPFDGPEPTASTKAVKSPAKAKTSKKASPAKKAPKHEPKAKVAREGSNKKAEVIALMKRGKGVTLAEIVEATGWQRHTIRGFVSILGSKGGEMIESSKNAVGERTYRIAK